MPRRKRTASPSKGSVAGETVSCAIWAGLRIGSWTWPVRRPFPTSLTDSPIGIAVMTSTGSGSSGPRTTAPGDKFGLRVSSVMAPHVSSCSSLAGHARAASGSALGVRPAILPERPLCLGHPREPACPGVPSGGAKPARALVCLWWRQAHQGRTRFDRDELSGCQRSTARHRLSRGRVAAQRVPCQPGEVSGARSHSSRGIAHGKSFPPGRGHSRSGQGPHRTTEPASSSGWSEDRRR